LGPTEEEWCKSDSGCCAVGTRGIVDVPNNPPMLGRLREPRSVAEEAEVSTLNPASLFLGLFISCGCSRGMTAGGAER
jgi:hypothetical protein